MVATASCVTAMGRIARSRPASGLSRFAAARSATGATVGAEEKIRFTSSILPKWARRTKSLDALLPVLYLRGVSTGDFQEALAALLGKAAPNLGPSAHVKPDRERVCDGASSNRADQGSPVGQDRQAHGVQTRQRCRKNMAAIKG